MAKNNSFIKLDGTLDGLTFYRANGENFVKTQSRITKKRLMTEDAFERTRENMREFGGAAKAGKGFRDAFAGIGKLMSDTYMGARNNGIMKQILNRGVGVRGEREINVEGYGIMLQGFEFNIKVPFGSIFYAPNQAPTIGVSRDGIRWTIADFNTGSYVNSPVGATHFKLVLAGGFVSNYEYQVMMDGYEPVDAAVNGVGSVTYSDAIPIGGMVGASTILDVDLTSVGTVPVTSVLFGAVGILFYQEVNANLYLLAQNNAMKVAVVG